MLKDIVGNEETVERLQLIANKGNMPHMIISVNQCRYADENLDWMEQLPSVDTRYREENIAIHSTELQLSE